MIGVSSLSKSKYGNWEFCQQQFFLTYVLGYDEGTTHKKTEKGSAVHAVLEGLAAFHKQYCETKSGLLKISTTELGEVSTFQKKLYEPTNLLPSEIDEINAANLKKKKAKPKQPFSSYVLPYGHVRLGEGVVRKLSKIAFNYYSKQSEHTWDATDLADIEEWTWNALDHSGGIFDPRNLEIVDYEKYFKLDVLEPWAKYDWFIGDKNIVGNLKLTGLMDLVVKIDDKTIEIIDWKTGQCKDWNTGKRKTLASLQEDFELIFYAYCAQQAYPEFDNIILTMFYMNDGGPFSFPFNKEQAQLCQDKIKDWFENIKRCNIPKLLHHSQGDYKCKNWCPFSRGENLCRQVHNGLRNYGMEYVINKYGKKEFS